MPNTPDLTDEIINNDDKFDRWYENYVLREERKRTGRESILDKAASGTAVTSENVGQVKGRGKRFVTTSR